MSHSALGILLEVYYKVNHMALNIKNAEVEQLAAEVARLANETKTEAIRQALLERKARLRVRRTLLSRKDRLEALLRNRIWPQIPAGVRGKRFTKRAQAKILGYQ
jgi:antitoxin VapB